MNKSKSLNVLVVVPARAGSKGVKNKNMYPICGKPLIGYTFDLLKQILYDYCISTDDSKIIDYAKDVGLKIYFKRPEYLAEDSSKILDVLAHSIMEMEKIKQNIYKFVLLLQPTAPLRTINDIQSCIELMETEQTDIWAKVIWGDIGRPDVLAKNLKSSYGIDLIDLLNVRTFLDHNRIWKEPKYINKSRVSQSTGAFSFEGKRINNNLIEESLQEHFKTWKPFVKKFGLLIIELHTVQSKLVARNLGRTAVTAYDATHGYSDQYIVEVDVFNKILAEAGLFPDKNIFRKFPKSDLATISVNLFKAKS